MTEFISRKYGNEGYEVIIKTDCHEHYKASEDFARHLIDHAKPVTENNVGRKWISVTERLPEKDQEILCLLGDGEFWLAVWNHCNDGLWTDGERWESKCFVTHWMPLPERPNE